MAMAIIVMPFFTYIKEWRRRRKAKGKAMVFIRKPTGGFDIELCPVFGRQVIRCIDGKGQAVPAVDKFDPRVGKEVYFIREHNPDIVIVQEKVTYKDEDGKKHTGLQEVVMSVEEAKKKGIDVDENPILHTGRPHILWPPFDNEGFFSAPISVPVVEVVEGYNEEVDTLSVAIGAWKTNPLYISKMGGTLLDEKVTAMMAFWSKINKELMDKLSKFVNPMVVYIALGLIVFMVGLCVYYITKQQSAISELKSLVSSIPGVGMGG